MIDITKVLEAIISLVTIVITTFLIPWIKEKIEVTKWEKIYNWVCVAVNAAEQIFVGTGLGAKKKEYVLLYLQSKGLSVDDKTVDNMIEAAVLEMNNAMKPSINN